MANRMNWSEEAAANQSGVAGAGRGGSAGVEVASRVIVRGTEEHDLHQAVVELLTWAAVKGLVWYHVPNGELRPGRTGAILAGMGTRPGVADFALVLPGGRAAFLELKSPTGRLSPAQRELCAACLAAGAVYEVARGTDEQSRCFAHGVRCGSAAAINGQKFGSVSGVGPGGRWAILLFHQVNQPHLAETTSGVASGSARSVFRTARRTSSAIRAWWSAAMPPRATAASARRLRSCPCV